VGPGPAETTEAIRLQLRSWPEVEAYLSRCKGVIVPLGSTEQHGPTGAIGTDALTAEAVALEVGRRTGVLVTPAQAFGMAEHHLGFAGTMSLQPATLLAVIHDLVLSLARHGFERIYVINGHGGNIATTKAAFAQAYGSAAARGLAQAGALRCKLANWFMAPEAMALARELYGEREGHHAPPPARSPSPCSSNPACRPSSGRYRRPPPPGRSTGRRISAAAIPMGVWDQTPPSPPPSTGHASWTWPPPPWQPIWNASWPSRPARFAP
jgi:creatinine amidohydrolase